MGPWENLGRQISELFVISKTFAATRKKRNADRILSSTRFVMSRRIAQRTAWNASRKSRKVYKEKLIVTRKRDAESSKLFTHYLIKRSNGRIKHYEKLRSNNRSHGLTGISKVYNTTNFDKTTRKRPKSRQYPFFNGRKSRSDRHGRLKIARIEQNFQIFIVSIETSVFVSETRSSQPKYSGGPLKKYIIIPPQLIH